MIPLETFRLALRALLRNKMRSFLTVLGIIIGVGAVIAMVAIGEGAKAQVEASFASMGSNLLVVLPGSTQSGGARGGFGSHADAHLGRPGRHPARGAGRSLRGRAAPLQRPAHERRSELGDARSTAPRPITS